MIKEIKNISKEIDSIILEIDSQHINDPTTSENWKEMVSILEKDMKYTINYILSVKDEKTIGHLSSIFDDLYFIFRSKKYDECLIIVKNKFPSEKNVIDNLLRYNYNGELFDENWNE